MRNIITRTISALRRRFGRNAATATNSRTSGS